MNTELLHLSFRLMTEKTFSHSMKSSLLISDVKAIIKTDAEIAPENQRLIFKGQLLKDECTLKSYGVESGSTIHVVGRALQPAEPDVSADNVQAGTEESGERTDASNPDSQAAGSTNRGYGMPMGLFMSPIYATISVSTPVTPNTSENSMEQVATQFFSGVVNSLLSSFSGASAGSVAQNASNSQPNQPQDELVMELEASTGVLRKVSSSIRSLSFASSVPNDSTAPVANDSSTVPDVNQASSSSSFNSVDASNLVSVEVNSNIPFSSSVNPTDSSVNNVSTLNEHDFEVVDSNDIFRPVKRSKSELIGSSRSNGGDFNTASRTVDCQEPGDSHLRSNSMPESLYDIYNFSHSSSNDLGSDGMEADKSSSVPKKKSELTKEFEEFESRRNKVLLTDPELVTSKLPWDCLNKLESIYEANSSFNVEYSYSRRGAFVRRPSYNKIELSSPCYLSDESVSFDPFIEPAENLERSRRHAEPEDPESLNEFLHRFESVNNKINDLIRRYDTGDRASQIELYKNLSSAMAIQTRIYSSLCAIFSWMHTQMVSPDSARRFSSRMGWDGSSVSATTPLLQNGTTIQTPMGNFSFATFTSDPTRFAVSTEPASNADPSLNSSDQPDANSNNANSGNE